MNEFKRLPPPFRHGDDRSDIDDADVDDDDQCDAIERRHQTYVYVVCRTGEKQQRELCSRNVKQTLTYRATRRIEFADTSA